MIRRATFDTPDLFEADETAWLDQMCTLIRQGRYDELDFEHLEEYLGDMAWRDKREAMSRLTAFLTERLKWESLSGKRSKEWRAAIEQQRQELAELLGSAAIQQHALERLAKVYGNAVRQAAAEIGLKVTAFPAKCPYSLERLLAEEPLDS